MKRNLADVRVDTRLIDERAQSVPHLFRHRVEMDADRPAYQYPVTFGDTDTWETTTWAQTRDTAYARAAGLIASDVELENSVAIASGTSYDWVVADLAIMCAGAATTTVYPTTLADDVAYILADAGCVVVFAEDAAQVAKIRSRRDALPDLRLVVAFDGTADEAGSDDPWVISVSELERRGRELLAASPRVVDERIDQVTSDHIATIIYTSGTTGRPKGVLLPHSAWTYEAAGVEAAGILKRDDLQYLWLPLSHVFGKVLLTLPLQVGFPSAVDGRLDKIVPNLAVVNPTFMGAAPRIFEKAHARIVEVLHEGSPVKRKLADWAFGVGTKVATLRENAEQPGRLLALQHGVADKLVLSKVRARFGTQMRFMISGSAPLNESIARWFAAVGLVIIEGYGMTETSAATTVNWPEPGAYTFGSIGWPLPGTEVKTAEDGELLVRGPGVMRGYHRHPEATAAAFDDDGFFHTGDIGSIDAFGFVRISDRKGDVFKTSGGKYVSPSHIETTFAGLCPLASHMLVQGASRNYASALVVLDPDAMASWAAHHGKSDMEYADLVALPEVRAEVQAAIDELNTGLNRWETIKKFAILDAPFSVEGGELTPSLKVRRKIVRDRYQDRIDALYSGS